MHTPIVSVIIPNYNHVRFLDERIQSVLNQTYRNYEVIILDDCSTDNSLDVINKYKDNPVISHIIVNKSNSGSTFKQWKKGMEVAQGDIVWIAESDDFCDEHFLETVMPLWAEYPTCSIIQTRSNYVNQDGYVIENPRTFGGGYSVQNGRDAIQNYLICSNFFIPNASAVTFRKSVALAVSDDYVSYSASGDRLFWIYMLEKGDLCTIDLPMNYFRQHEDNKVSARKEKNGVQCRENYAINQYLHKKKYVYGKWRYRELRYYWDYIHSFVFDSPEIKNELIDLWFPGINRFELVYLFKRKIYSFLK